MNKSLYFRDLTGGEYFLFQIINFGLNNELKFIFNVKNQGTGIIHSPDASFTAHNDTIKPYAEISYHQDGYMHCKLPKYTKEDQNDYRDRIKRIPLNEIDDWMPVIKYNVVDYKICKKPQSTGAILLPKNDLIFNGEPFECIIWLGHLKFATPPVNNPNEMLFRLNDVAKDIDLIAWILKSDYQGKVLTIPNSNISIYNRSNVVQIVEKK